MKKKELIRHFRRMRNIDQREEFMRRHEIKFSYDKYDNVTVFADDGTLQMFPIRN